MIRSHRHSANRRRVYEETRFDFGSGGARARLDGAVGERSAARRRPRPAPERHADREAGGLSRIRCALRAGIHLGLRPLRPLLLPPLRLSGQTITAPIGCEAARGAASLFMAPGSILRLAG